MAGVGPLPDVDTYLNHVEAGDRLGALRIALSVGQTTSPAEVITRLLGPAQEHVGRLWETNSWDVSQEYAATSVTEFVLAAAASRWDPPRRSTGRVVVVCASGEWHALPARMAAELLGLAGWPVVSMGASLPAERLERYLRQDGVLACLVSCTVASCLPGVRQLAEVAHNSGVPVLVGGQAVDERRATVAGADGWAADASSASVILERWAAAPPPLRGPAAVPPGYVELESRRAALAGDALDQLFLRLPELASPGSPFEHRLYEDLDYILAVTAAAILMDDHTITPQYLSWLDRVLCSRAAPPELLPALVDSVLAVCDDALAAAADAVSGAWDTVAGDR